MRKVMAVFLCCLLTGCSALPRPREMENMALARTLGVDFTEEGCTVTASAGPEAEGEEPQIFTGSGPSVEKAMETMRDSGENTVFLGYADRILLGGPLTKLDSLFEYIHTDRELSLGALVWYLPENSAADMIRAGAERRLEPLQPV